MLQPGGARLFEVGVEETCARNVMRWQVRAVDSVRGRS